MVFNCFSEVKREFVDDADYYKVTLVTSQAYQDGFTALYALKCSPRRAVNFSIWAWILLFQKPKLLLEHKGVSSALVAWAVEDSFSLKMMDSTLMLPMVSMIFQATLAKIFTYRRETSFVNHFLILLNGFQLFNENSLMMQTNTRLLLSPVKHIKTDSLYYMP